MPPGITPPFIVRYSATSVPIVQIAVSSDTLTEQQIFDYCQNFVIQQLGTVQGARVPQPWGGKQRQVMVYLDLPRMYALGVSPQDVSTAISNQNLIIPAGTAKIGATEYNVRLNSSPDVITAFNDIPIKTVNGAPIYIKDVGHADDGYAVQTNVVRREHADRRYLDPAVDPDVDHCLVGDGLLAQHHDAGRHGPGGRDSRG
jgi:multidrug efflux pump subunit AcrB